MLVKLDQLLHVGVKVKQNRTEYLKPPPTSTCTVTLCGTFSWVPSIHKTKYGHFTSSGVGLLIFNTYVVCANFFFCYVHLQSWRSRPYLIKRISKGKMRENALAVASKYSPTLKKPAKLLQFIYPLVNQHSNGISPFWIGKSSSKDPFSIAMLVYQGVTVETWLLWRFARISLILNHYHLGESRTVAKICPGWVNILPWRLLGTRVIGSFK